MTIIVNKQFDTNQDMNINREKFIKRNAKAIKEALKHTITTKSITDIDKEGTEVTIKGYDLDEPSMRHEKGTGTRDYVTDGNKTFERGKRWLKEQMGKGGKAGNSGSGEDEFTFRLSKEEFIEFFLADLKLPNLLKKAIEGSDNKEYKRAGYSKDGIQATLDVKKTFTHAISRRMIAESSLLRRIKQAELEEDEELVLKLEEELKNIPYLSDVDIRYRHKVLEDKPISKAVMFCLMDVSASMGEQEKDIAKRFFLLLYLFLSNNYEGVDIRFIRHTTSAKEVDEKEFFYARSTGGTLVSTGYKLINKIVAEEYPLSEWNVYVAQSSDGDNWPEDYKDVEEQLIKYLLPACQYFAYIEASNQEIGTIKIGGTGLWEQLESINKMYENMEMRQVKSPDEIYPVFRGLFTDE